MATLDDHQKALVKAGKLCCNGCCSDKVSKQCFGCGHVFCLDCYGTVDHCIWCEAKAEETATR